MSMNVGLGWQYSVDVDAGKIDVSPFVFTFAGRIGLTRGQVIGTDMLKSYSNQNFSDVYSKQLCNGCVRAHHEGNTMQIQELQDKGVENVKIVDIFPTYIE
ncbi:MAG: hypothetical protein JXC85_02520 [Candidatus Aenigmarchaeota archaeon]|nr:hypothetical protein [Candidatus Aenigmarchaeota archaeon]